MHVTLGKALIIQGIDIIVDQGDLVSIVGPNGAGKTTLLRAISKFTSFKGFVSFKGQDISSFNQAELVKIGLVHCAEGRHLFNNLSVFENLKLGAYLFNDKERIEQDIATIYEMFPVLDERRKQLAGTLSGGEQQMLAIGRALMSRPKMLLLDEPSTGLSVKFKDVMSEKINEIRKRGVTVLLVEQDTQMAFELANRVYILEQGKIALEGEVKDVANNQYIKEIYLGMK